MEYQNICTLMKKENLIYANYHKYNYYLKITMNKNNTNKNNTKNITANKKNINNIFMIK